MLIDFAELSPKQVYHTMVQAIIPRPIAWVLSDHGNGQQNLAPFSYFTGVCSDPPLLMLSVGHKSDGSKKDTWVNIQEREHFVVHIFGRDQLEPMVASSESLPHGESEVEALGLATEPIDRFPLPRVVGPAIAMACRKHAIHVVGAQQQGLILGEIEKLWVSDDAGSRDEATGRVHIDPNKVDPPARLGGNAYALFGETTDVTRPG